MPKIYAAKLRAKHFTFFYGGANIKLFIFKVTDEEMQEHYDNFFEEVFVECEDEYGEIEELNVCDNLGTDHIS